MTDTRKPVHTGGCQCGAVRYALYAEPTNPHVCYCRMCQKAFGSYFAPLAGVPPKDFAWVKGTPGVFKSSEAAERRLLREMRHAAVLPLRRQGPHLGVARQPRRSLPRGAGQQYGIESRLPLVATLTALPGTRTEDDVPAPDRARLQSRQHPDVGAESDP